MNAKKYNSKEREPEIEKMQALWDNLNKHHKYLVAANKKLNEIEKDLKKMDQYYFGDWINDYNNFHSGKNFEILSQDHIYNIFQDIHNEKLKLLRSLVKKIY